MSKVTVLTKTRLNYPVRTDHVKLYEFLYGRSVVLVGGKDNYDENILNSADVVVRVNQHWVRQGGRCEGLYCAACDPLTLDLFKFPPVFMCYRVTGMYARHYQEYCLKHRLITVPYQNERYDGASPYGAEFEWTNIFGHEANCKPFTGTLAIRHLASFPIRSLYITGMDFHIHSFDLDENNEQTKVVEVHEREGEEIVTRKVLARGPHMIQPQIDWLRRYMKCDKRISVDLTLKEVLTLRGTANE